ncbi:MAG: 4-hydroxy-tetrahydrodipicolinate reductase, partial [Rhodospirillaceae bacterium]|nr:4-hydroxy-tetrahydrodipicolinate reductase [Rhodospirillaceae bacterium]MBT5838124.1 4-hydroxy-tetrahydrodipicolinate reductase [Rhodospirillaceae bacterium]
MKIGILGCAGRMGQMLVRQVAKTAGAELAGGTEATGHPALGADIAAIAGLEAAGLEITDNAAALIAASDVVIEFSLPAATGEHVDLASLTGVPLVIGTTGHDADQMSQIEAAAAGTAIVKAMNFSAGVNVLFALTERLAATLDEDFDIEIVEMHHKHKVDAPSGTAIGLGEAAAKGRGIELDAKAVRGRDGISKERRPGDIGFASMRGGDVVGEHSVIFAGAGERIELHHKAASREIFAAGAVRAALWLEGKEPGLYDMFDVLGFG